MSQYFGHICVILGLCIVLVNGAPQNSNPTASPLSVQNPLTSSDSAVSKEKKIQEKRFSDLKAGFLNKGTAGYDRDRDRYGSSRPDPVEHRYNANNNIDTRGSSSINGDGFITSYGAHESRYPTTGGSNGYGANRDRVSVGTGGYYGSDGYADDGWDNSYRRPYGPPQAIDMPGYTYNKGHDSLDWGQNGYGHGYQGGSYQLSKAALIPLAGAALLGLAAVLVTNPAILQMGMFSGKRRKRDLTANEDKSMYAQSLAYNGQQNNKQ